MQGAGNNLAIVCRNIAKRQSNVVIKKYKHIVNEHVYKHIDRKRCRGRILNSYIPKWGKRKNIVFDVEVISLWYLNKNHNTKNMIVSVKVHSRSPHIPNLYTYTGTNEICLYEFRW